MAEALNENKPLFVNSIVLPAKRDNVNKAISFIEGILEDNGFDMMLISRISICVDELFSNVCFYAYPNGDGDCTISVEIFKDNLSITFEDHGVAFDPTKILEPDVSKGSEERGIGGLGIFIVRKTVDDIKYNRVGNRNILIIKKNSSK